MFARQLGASRRAVLIARLFGVIDHSSYDKIAQTAHTGSREVARRRTREITWPRVFQNDSHHVLRRRPRVVRRCSSRPTESDRSVAGRYGHLLSVLRLRAGLVPMAVPPVARQGCRRRSTTTTVILPATATASRDSAARVGRRTEPHRVRARISATYGSRRLPAFPRCSARNGVESVPASSHRGPATGSSQKDGRAAGIPGHAQRASECAKDIRYRAAAAAFEALQRRVSAPQPQHLVAPNHWHRLPKTGLHPCVLPRVGPIIGSRRSCRLSGSPCGRRERPRSTWSSFFSTPALSSTWRRDSSTKVAVPSGQCHTGRTLSGGVHLLDQKRQRPPADAGASLRTEARRVWIISPLHSK